MDKISSFSVCYLSIGSIAMIFCTALSFYKSVPMWVLTALLVMFSVIHIYMYYLQERGEVVKFKWLETLKFGVIMLLIGWVLGISYMAAQSSSIHSFKEKIELWIERVKTI